MIKGGISVIIKTHVHVVELNVYFRRKLQVITNEYVSSSQAGRRSDFTPDTRARFCTEQWIGSSSVGLKFVSEQMTVTMFLCTFYYMGVPQASNPATEYTPSPCFTLVCFTPFCVKVPSQITPILSLHSFSVQRPLADCIISGWPFILVWILHIFDLYRVYLHPLFQKRNYGVIKGLECKQLTSDVDCFTLGVFL